MHREAGCDCDFFGVYGACRQGEAPPMATVKGFSNDYFPISEYHLILRRPLVANRDRIMLKEEMMKAVWPNAFVEQSNLTQQVSALRKALGEAAGEDRYIV